VREAENLATAAVYMYMTATDAMRVAESSQAHIADAALAQLFTPMAQLLSPALLHVVDRSSSSSSDARAAGDAVRKKSGAFNMTLGICAKCAFDIDTGEAWFGAETQQQGVHERTRHALRSRPLLD
jgi:hypothetical protein